MAIAVLCGFAFGCGLQFFGHSWVWDALHFHTRVSKATATFATGAILAYGAVFTGLSAALFHLVHKKIKAKPSIGFALLSAAIFASTFTFGEWIRFVCFKGFTSLSLSYAWVDTFIGQGLAPTVGNHGLSWVAYLFCAFIALAVSASARVRVVLAVVSVAACALVFGLSRMEWVAPAGAPLSYRLLQSNVPQALKFDPRFRAKVTQTLVDQITSAPADLIITPETAFPFYLPQLPEQTLPALKQFSDSTGSTIFAGIATGDAQGRAHNSMIVVEPGHSALSRYDKRRLMPFGEYNPPGFGWFSDRLQISLKSLSPGADDQRPIRVKGRQIGFLICHEDLVADDARSWLPDVGLFLNPSNLAWFDGSSALDQRLQISQMRAMEVGRPILRATNTGITALIDHRGQVVNPLPKTKILTASGLVQPMQGMTPFGRYGDLFFWIAVGITVIAWAVAVLRKRSA